MKYKILKNDFLDINHPITKKPIRLYRILALKTFETLGGTVHEGTIGGFIQSEANLNQSDSSWVFNTGKLFDDALLVGSVITDNAVVFQNSIIQDSVCRHNVAVSGEATVIESNLYDGSSISGKSEVHRSTLWNASKVSGNAKVKFSVLHHGSQVIEHAVVTRCILKDTTTISGTAIIENCQYSGHTKIRDGEHLNETVTTDIQLNIEQFVTDKR